MTERGHMRPPLSDASYTTMSLDLVVLLFLLRTDAPMNRRNTIHVPIIKCSKDPSFIISVCKSDVTSNHL